MSRVVPLSLVLLASVATAALAQAAEKEPLLDLTAAKARFAKLVGDVLQKNQSDVPGASVAWVVDGQVVHEAGYGLADLKTKTPAAADTIYRAGSISKLLNAVAVMQLVEQGRLDLDAPIDRAVPEFQIINPFELRTSITLRQLLCHRSGMIREAPVGGYLDGSEPGITATLASVAQCVLVTPPNTRTRYSNVGPTIAGRAVEIQSGLAYERYQQEHVLDPLGMKSSAWKMTDSLRPRLARGRMRVASSERTTSSEEAPQFELGTIPAGNLYSTAGDLAKFAAWVMGGDDVPEPGLLKREKLREMCLPQLTDQETGYGLGFRIDRYRGHETVSHSGAVYGFSTSLVVLPKHKIGVVVLCNGDLVGGLVRLLVEASLDELLAAKAVEPLPETPTPRELSAREAARFAGDYESESYRATIYTVGPSLRADFSRQLVLLTPTEPLKFGGDGLLMHRSPFEFHEGADGKIDGFTAGGQRFRRVPLRRGKELPTPEIWQKYSGVYGPAYIPVVIYSRHGNLYASVENEYDYRLKPIDRVTFGMPPGMYAEEHLVFQTNPEGEVTGLLLANMYLPRQRSK